MKSRNLDSYTRLGLWDLRLKIFLIFSKEGYFCNDVSKMHEFDVVIKPCWIAAPICIQLIPSRTEVQFRRNLYGQFEVDYFGTWDIHFSTISVTNQSTSRKFVSTFVTKAFGEEPDKNVCFLTRVQPLLFV